MSLQPKTMKTYVTKCLKCNLTWYNQDNRDYSNDRCSSCKNLVTVMGLKEIELSRGPLQIPSREMGLNVE